MQNLNLVVYGDPALQQQSSAVTQIDSDVCDLAKRMVHVMDEYAGIGLAASQIGIPKKIIVVRLEVEDEPLVLINPEIVSRSGIQEKEEGCLSIPGVSLPITRAQTIRIAGIRLDGNPIELEADGLAARAFQHEADHVDGILISDRITRKQKKEIAEHLEAIKRGDIKHCSH